MTGEVEVIIPACTANAGKHDWAYRAATPFSNEKWECKNCPVKVFVPPPVQ